MCVCVCVCERARAHVCVCAHACEQGVRGESLFSNQFCREPKTALKIF